MIKTFRGLMADDSQDAIVLHTNDGFTGYRIVNFQIMPEKPFAEESEHVVKIYKVSQTANSATVDMSDQTLLGAAMINNAAGGYQNPSIPVIIFEHEIFNQDIYVTHVDINSTDKCNYYIELEQVKLDLNESTVATLKDIRNKGIRTLTT